MGKGRRRRRRLRGRLRHSIRKISNRFTSVLHSALSHDIGDVEPQELYSPKVTKREEAFVEYLLQLHHDKAKTLDEEIVEAQRLLATAENELAKLQEVKTDDAHERRQNYMSMGRLRTETIRLRGRLAVFTAERGTADPFRERFRKQYREICAIPRVLEAYLAAPRLVYVTDVLYGKDHQGLWHEIGPFRISFDLINPQPSSFTWVNEWGTRNNMHGPPNITKKEGYEGTVTCMGNIATDLLKKAKEELDYPAMVAISVRYPECPGIETNNPMMHWALVEPDRVPQWYIETFGL